MRSIERINAARDIVTRHDAGFIPARIAIQIMYDIIMLPEPAYVSDDPGEYKSATIVTDSLYTGDMYDEDEFEIVDPDKSKDPVFTSFDDEAEAATEELHKLYPPHHDPEAPANIWNPRGKVALPTAKGEARAEKEQPPARLSEKPKEQQGGVAPTRRQTDALEALQMLEEHGGDMTVAGVAEAMEITAPAAKSLLDALVEKGKITQTKEGRAFHYQIVKG